MKIIKYLLFLPLILIPDNLVRPAACQGRRYFLLCIKKAINMEPALLNEVPSLDLADFTSGDAQRKQRFVEDLGAAFTNIGFVAIKNHGLSDTLRNDLYESVKQFFSQPDDIKKKNELTARLLRLLANERPIWPRPVRSRLDRSRWRMNAGTAS